MKGILKAVVFYEVGKLEQGHFFYNSTHEFTSDSGKLVSVIDLTWPKAIALMKDKGIDPVANFKMNMASYSQH